MILFSNKEDCSGCGACYNACPKKAISMQEDDYGFVYPVIDNSLCIECGLCKTVCGYQNIPDKNEPIRVYAATYKNESSLKRSASGGAFAAFAGYVLGNGGVVYGSAFVEESNKLTPRHIRIVDEKDLVKLQGSKYVQSDISLTYKEAENDLKYGMQVLFSGTPCQIAGLKTFLKKEYKNLITVEIICHGVPSARFFHNFISVQEKKMEGRITEYYFRDKSKGQGMITRIVVEKRDLEQHQVIKPGRVLSYMYFFLKSYTYRKNCYSCKFATKERVADITLGDFWGFHEEYPEIDPKEGFSNQKGISCILINTQKGADILANCSDKLLIMESEFEKVARHNDQLRVPSKYSPLREKILSIYKEGGYEEVEKYFINNFRSDRIKEWITFMTPKSVKRSIKRILALVRGR